MKTITESDLQPPTTPGDGWYIIEAAGEHATRVEDTELTQQLTPEVLATVAAAGVPAYSGGIKVVKSKNRKQHKGRQKS